MHLMLLLVALSLAIAVRWAWRARTESWNTRWQTTLGAFLFPPLLLITSAIAILCMGPRGQMMRWHEGWGSYGIAIGFLMVAVFLFAQLAWQARKSFQQVKQMPEETVLEIPVRLLEHSTPYIAQIGFWNPELVVSDSLLETLDESHLQVTLTHEQAHRHYRDTFWFFWLGGLRRLTAWLPNTEALWQELILLRELRADRWAARQTDGLLLAEALFSIVSASQMQTEPWIAALSGTRLDERIDALLDETESEEPQSYFVWMGLSIVLLPLFMIPFHF
ncbi:MULTISPECIES: M56 family metallopeptidase [Leptolyngbya]|uniref:M56 family metallopeptidase n=1 Tax=Leptolyngbya boryana CZ1 TaxID=3060204 RepID=A0AA96XAV1_LEPBY|nr:MULTISPECIES: M56 family metallopeptidase [Leptolyngbya]MBD1855642.1 M56 family metallopeptidase [Leptolyngbya sp. FACHB-1624]MCY6488635.1 M56 family metallopeptidase [Leptolyngbya sp. GGD]WNZ48755.1 M56 family metallopeptidase [Leptolyngbya boryana CZ1]